LAEVIGRRGEEDAGRFLGLTAADELDPVRVNPEFAATWAPESLELLRGPRQRVSEMALASWAEALALTGPGRRS